MDSSKNCNVKFTKGKANNLQRGEVLMTPELAKELLEKCSPGSNSTLEERLELIERISRMMETPSGN